MYLAGVSPETALCSETFAADVAVERSVLQALNLRLVVPVAKGSYLLFRIFHFVPYEEDTAVHCCYQSGEDG